MTIYTLKAKNFKDILGCGAGIIPRGILKSKTLTMGEKVLYAYLSSIPSDYETELPSFEKNSKRFEY